MKIVLFGGSGQLGFEIMKRARELNFEVIAPVISELDITDAKQVHFICARVRPDVIINCAAYTAVDKAEEERDEAFRINCDGTANIALAAREVGAQLLHVSTDYVFPGTGNTALKEDAATGPLNVYGESKLAGELCAREILKDKCLIVRTSSLHGQHGTNFVHTMIKLMLEKEVVKVVCDQFMSPTWAGWLAESMLDLSRIARSKVINAEEMIHAGIVHASCSGVCSWYEFACEIHSIISSHIDVRARVEETTAANFPRPAKRPAYSAFDCSALSRILGRAPIHWREGLRMHLSEIDYGRTLSW